MTRQRFAPCTLIHHGHRAVHHGFLCFFILLVFLAPPHIGSAGIFPVTTIADGPLGSLRAAIDSANKPGGGRDTITFSIQGSGPHTLMILSQLPQLTDPAGVLIDGLSQPGSAVGSNPPSTLALKIIIDGTNAGPAHGFWITSPLNIIRGLVIQNFQRDGIRVQATPSVTHTNTVYCNIIGLNVTGTTRQGNGKSQSSPWAGVNILVNPQTSGTVHTTVVRKNLISSNYSEGVSISSCPPGDALFNRVDSNYLGTDITGMVSLGNTTNGVYIGEAAHDNVVESNLISGNDTDGVCIVGYVDASTQWYTSRNIVTRNVIGLAANRTTPLPNRRHGVSIGRYGQVWFLGFAPENTVSLDTIAHNGGCGVMVWEHPMNAINSDQNRITQNAMYKNGQLGIDLDNDGVTVNDPNDLDPGANQLLNMPVITNALYAGGTTTISGTINIDTNPANATVEVFKAASDPAGYGEGAKYLASAIPNGAGNWSCTTTGVVNVGDTIVATTTDVNKNTSEFSKILNVVLPVELESFSALRLESSVYLRWRTSSELDNAGFEIQRCEDGNAWHVVGFVEGHGTSLHGCEYCHEDPLGNIDAQDVLRYRLKQIDYDGSFTYSPEAIVRFGETAASPIFHAPYPSPVNTECIIPFFLPEEVPVSFSLYGMAGMEIIRLLDHHRYTEGVHVLRINVDRMHPGTYLLRCEAGATITHRRIVIQR